MAISGGFSDTVERVQEEDSRGQSPAPSFISGFLHCLMGQFGSQPASLTRAELQPNVTSPSVPSVSSPVKWCGSEDGGHV